MWYFICFIFLLQNSIETKVCSPQELASLIKQTVRYEVRALLNIIAGYEGTTSLATIKREKKYVKPFAEEYQKVFAHSERKVSFFRHPERINTLLTTAGIEVGSTASGRYQFLKKTWNDTLERVMKYKDHPLIQEALSFCYEYLPLIYHKDIQALYPSADSLLTLQFGPFLQDLCTIINLHTSGALSSLFRKKYHRAIQQVAKVWATFPCCCMEENRSNFADHNAVTTGRVAVKNLITVIENSRSLKKEIVTRRACQ